MRKRLSNSFAGYFCVVSLFSIVLGKMNNTISSELLEDLKLLHIAMEAFTTLKEISDLTEKKRKRSCCVRCINRDRNKNGFFNVSFLKIKELDSAQFFIYTRMSPELYNLLLISIKPYLTKTSIRQPISPECRLAVILLYLSQGTSIQSLAWSFKLGKETVRSIILETAEILWKMLFPIYMSEPNAHDFRQISSEFWNMWNMPNCIGAIDGKHIAIRCPPKSGSQFFCYKKHFSIVLMAVCDAKYQFTYIDVGAYGSQSDGGVLQASRFGKRRLGNNLLIPVPKNLPNTQTRIPHYFVADAAFPLGLNLMRPYSGTLLPPEKENFNKRLSRARRTIENSFGILVSRWRILLTTLHMFPENAEKIVLACVVLHNYLMINKPNASYCPNNYVDWEDSDGQQHDGLWRSEVRNNIPSIGPSAFIHQYGGRQSTTTRNILCEYLKQN